MELKARSKKAEAKREEILQAATKLLREKGYHGTSMQDIADAVGLYKGSLYQHIDNKEDVVYEIIFEGLKATTDALEQTCATASTFDEKLRLAILHHIRHTALHTDTLAVLLENTKHLSKERQMPIIEQQHRYEKNFIDILEGGISAGEFRPVHVKVVAFAIMGMCNWVYRWYSSHGSLSSDQIAQIFYDLIIRGLRPSVGETDAVDIEADAMSLLRLSQEAGDASST